MRISRDELRMQHVAILEQRGTCKRRKVAFVLIDKHGRVLSEGYNGVASGHPHCSEPGHECPGADLPSGTGLDQCQALHAEQNAILHLKDPYAVDTAYGSCSPCDSCIKLLLGTSCRRIVVRELYPHSNAVRMWIEAGRQIELFSHGCMTTVTL